MILCDVGVLLHAMIEKAEHHALCRRELERLRSTPERLALSELVLAAVLRIGTNPRIFRPCPSAQEVFEFLEALGASRRTLRISPGPRHWTIFKDLVLAQGIQGPDTTDAYLAALAMEHGCEWWTTDAGFSRFPGLLWRNLLE